MPASLVSGASLYVSLGGSRVAGGLAQFQQTRPPLRRGAHRRQQLSERFACLCLLLLSGEVEAAPSPAASMCAWNPGGSPAGEVLAPFQGATQEIRGALLLSLCLIAKVYKRGRLDSTKFYLVQQPSSCFQVAHV